MAQILPSLTDVTSAIQLALAPVFLLTGIAGLLNVMAGRLSRIIDRGRALAERPHPTTPVELDAMMAELHSLERRRHYTSAAITACTIAALLTCTVVAALFLEAMLDLPLSGAIGVLFTATTLVLVVGLAYFLREVHMATKLRLLPPPGAR